MFSQSAEHNGTNTVTHTAASLQSCVWTVEELTERTHTCSGEHGEHADYTPTGLSWWNWSLSLSLYCFFVFIFQHWNIKCLNIKFPQSCQSSALFTAAVFILFETQRDALSGLFCSWNSITRDRKRGHLTSDQQRAAAWVKPTSRKLTFHFCSSGWRSSLKPRRQECDCDLFVFVVTRSNRGSYWSAACSDSCTHSAAKTRNLRRKNFIIQSQKCCNSHL